MKQIYYILLTVGVGLVTLGVTFNHSGALNVQTDTQIYVNQILYADGKLEINDDIEKRAFKPFYGEVGSLLTPAFTEHEAILIINLLFYFGLIVFTFFFLREIGFSDTFATVGVAWVATGYPMLKYGLTLLTDISGWFFAVATITVFLVGLRKNNSYLLLVSSGVAFIGSLCKETGVLGLFFAGLYLLAMLICTRKLEYIKKIVLISAPFILLQASFLYFLFQKNETAISFVSWYFYNKETYASSYHNLFYFFFTELSTFIILWAYCGYAVYLALKRKISINLSNYLIGGSLFISVLPVLMWPMFLTRVLYIQYLIIIPVALSALVLWRSRNQEKRKTMMLLIIAPVVCSVGLFFIASGGSLFDVLKDILELL